MASYQKMWLTNLRRAPVIQARNMASRDDYSRLLALFPNAQPPPSLRPFPAPARVAAKPAIIATFTHQSSLALIAHQPSRARVIRGENGNLLARVGPAVIAVSSARLFTITPHKKAFFADTI